MSTAELNKDADERLRTLHRDGLLRGDDARVLTVWQFWAFAIAEGFKTAENRSRRTHYRGRILIHAGRNEDKHAPPLVRFSRPAAIRLDQLGGRNNVWNALDTIPSRFHTPPPTLAQSAVIAVANLTDCHPADDNCCAPWGEPGVFHWTLDSVVALPRPVPCNGRLGLWRPDLKVLDAVVDQLHDEASQT